MSHCEKCNSLTNLKVCSDCSKEEFKPNTANTYGSIKADCRLQELELIAFTLTTGEDIENLLSDYDDEHGTKYEEEYIKLCGDDEE
jgi:hypothetical protein